MTRQIPYSLQTLIAPYNNFNARFLSLSLDSPAEPQSCLKEYLLKVERRLELKCAQGHAKWNNIALIYFFAKLDRKKQSLIFTVAILVKLEQSQLDILQ